MPDAPESRVAELLSPANPEWLRAGVLRWLETGEALHQCLGIGRADHMRALRDHCLVRAWLVTDDTMTPWRRCVELAAKVHEFETRAWPRLRELPDPDPQWSMMRRDLWCAFRYAGAIGVPSTARMLSEVVKSAGVYISRMAVED